MATNLATSIPVASQPLTGPGELATRAWYRFFQLLSQSFPDLSGIEAEIAALQSAIAGIELGWRLQALDSIAQAGAPSPGSIVSISLQGDQSAPPANEFYGTGATAAKGWQSFVATLGRFSTDNLPEGQLSNYNPVVQATAQVALTYPQVVAVDGAGNAYPPDLSMGADVSRIMGVTLNAATTGNPVRISRLHMFTESAWSWAPGRIYCTTTGGALTQAVPASPSAVVEVGRALTPTTVLVNVQPAILI